ncbi:MAG TPA: CpsD/CapB family tyrosine-protein kinase [Candidatus Acidoferrum sp.]|jgi:capsular exopolysaccharide synthesis family protein
MSKFFDETQKAHKWAPQVAEAGRVDVVSVIDAIKQDDNVVPPPLVPQFEPQLLQNAPAVEVPVVEVPVAVTEKPVRGPIKISQSEKNLPQPVVEAYGSLRARVMKLQASKGIRSLMLTSSVPAEGKTLTSLNLAVSCAKLHNLRILLVDGDLRSRGLTRLLSMPEGPGLSDFLGRKATAEKTVLPTEFDNLFVLGAGSLNGQPSELFASPLWSEFISWAGQSYGIVIVDAPPIHGLSDAELISSGCDGVLMVVRALSTSRELAQKCVNRLDKRKLIGTVFNGLPSSPDIGYGYYGNAG